MIWLDGSLHARRFETVLAARSPTLVPFGSDLGIGMLNEYQNVPMAPAFRT
jgi:hypothetical protein